MSTPLLIIATGVELVVLLAALAVGMTLVARRLRAIAEALGELSSALPDAERRTDAVGSAAAEVNWALEQLAESLPALADRAEELAARR